MTPQLTRLRIGLAAGAAALATAGALTATGAAQAGPTTMHLVAKEQPRASYFPKGRPRLGARAGFGDKISGDDTGFARGACTVTDKGMLCTIQVQLSKGTLSVQGLAPERSRHTPFAITGGTGAYDGARGTVRATDVNATTSDLAITLKP